jgi:hypothetical protein
MQQIGVSMIEAMLGALFPELHPVIMESRVGPSKHD